MLSFGLGVLSKYVFPSRGLKFFIKNQLSSKRVIFVCPRLRGILIDMGGFSEDRGPTLEVSGARTRPFFGYSRRRYRRCRRKVQTWKANSP